MAPASVAGPAVRMDIPAAAKAAFPAVDPAVRMVPHKATPVANARPKAVEAKAVLRKAIPAASGLPANRENENLQCGFGRVF